MSIADKLIEQAISLELQAEECEVVADHFYPQYKTALAEGDAGHPEQAKNALRLHIFAITRRDEAVRMRREANDLRMAAEVVWMYESLRK